jgi:hypothetical protein
LSDAVAFNGARQTERQEEVSNKKREIILDDKAILEALIHYIHDRHENGQVVDVEWMLIPEEGFELPPIKGISVRCTLEVKEGSRKAGKGLAPKAKAETGSKVRKKGKTR